MFWLLTLSIYHYDCEIIGLLLAARLIRRKRVCCSLPRAFFKSYTYSLRFRRRCCRSFQSPRISLLPPCGIRGCLGRARRVDSDRHTRVAPVPFLFLLLQNTRRFTSERVRSNDDVTRWRLGDDGWSRIWSSCLVSLHFVPFRPASAPVGTSINAFSGDCVIV